MDLWRGSLTNFLRSAESGALPGDMTGQFVRIYQIPPSPAEVQSWSASLPILASALRDLRGLDVGVRVSGVSGTAISVTSEANPPPLKRELPDMGVATEYHLPLSGQRLDVLLCGRDRGLADCALTVELKQWSSVILEDDFTENVKVRGVEHAHPSQQALDYADWLADYHSAFATDGTRAKACSFLHNMDSQSARALREPRFGKLLMESPLFDRGQVDALVSFVATHVGSGEGRRVLERVTGGQFRPAPRVLDNLERVIQLDERWHLIDTQRIAYNAIFAEVRKLNARRGRSAIIVRGGPGTGKSVIAVQLLADALRLGLRAAHVTGGKAFTTTMRGKFKGADRLFQWNMSTRTAPFQGLDLLLVDEAHRVRKTSDMQYTKKSERDRKSQTEELVDAAKVTAFFLDNNQFVRPDEVGTTALFRSAMERLKINLREYDLTTQFRCGGCGEYVAWVDHLLHFCNTHATPWPGRYQLTLVDRPSQLDDLVQMAARCGERARIVAGFCWKWSDSLPDETLVDDVSIDAWRRPWNRKASKSKRYRPHNHPYTLWAETPVGAEQVGCIYSAQGFEFDRVGVIWGQDLVWRTDKWMAQPSFSHDSPVKRSKSMIDLVRNAYRVLLTRGIKETTLLCLDDETRAHIEDALRGMQ